MKKKRSLSCAFLFFLFFTITLLGCTTDSSMSQGRLGASGEKRNTTQQLLSPKAPGTVLYGDGALSVDASNADEGYLMIRAQGTGNKKKLQITTPGGTVYTYTLSQHGTHEVFPLTGGSGSYHIDILEQVQNDLYALMFTQDIAVSISDELLPFLYPNQYVWFTEESQAVKLAAELSDKSFDDLSFVENVYHYVTQTIQYDEPKALTVPTDYIPDVDDTLVSKTGICFDYAALMAAMLRSQSIPTKLEVGYSGEAYHAWVSVYLKEQGWVDKIIQFDGKSWTLMDPTLAASNNSRAVRKYIGDGSNYTVKYSY